MPKECRDFLSHSVLQVKGTADQESYSERHWVH